MTWLDKYVGVPFKSQGRSFKGVDCWGLVWILYQNELNVTLPIYGEISAKDLKRVAKNISEGCAHETWRPVDQPCLFDVLVMHFYGTKRIGHVGIFVGGNRVLHTERSFDSVVVPLDHMTIRHRIVGYRRYKDR